MSNEPEYRDANPNTENLPNKGRNIIQFVAGGLALGVLGIIGARIKPIGLIIGSFTFISGLIMLVRRRQFFYKPGLIVTIAGFLLLLTHPRFGVVAAFAGTFVVILALGLVVFGLAKAIKLAWDVQK
jgi:hypothetical protein